MEFRDIRPGDGDAIADVAEASLRASYGHFLDGETIEGFVAELYDPDRIADAADGVDWIVADDGGVVGFAQTGLVDADPPVGEVDWLHVAPGERGEGLGRQLLGQAQEAFEKRDASAMRGSVLAENEHGVAFYEANGFERVDERPVSVAGDEFDEYVYEESLGDTADEAVVETVAGPNGDLVADLGHGERGTLAPFYPLYRSRDLSERYGWLCSNCESIETNMDSMGRVACADCDNSRDSTRWDASYL